MTSNDMEYLKLLLDKNIIQEPVLELGTGYGGVTCREMIQQAKLQYFGTDIEKNELVDFTADFEQVEDLKVFAGVGKFGSVLVFNVLEHSFNPIAILDNCLKILCDEGVLVVITPSIWPLHSFPFDTWRINPNFYEEYARRRNLNLIEN